jgi:putative transposase
LLYHVIARGNHRQATFLTDLDYEAYLTRLEKYQKRYGVRLYAYCLMPNHVHLLAQTSELPLSKFMQALQQAYTQRFNRVHAKVGHLFQGRYKSIICDGDEYLLTLIRYIHLNPVRARLVDDPDTYPYSGHRAYLTANERGLIDPAPVLNMLGGRVGYWRFVRAAIGQGHEERYYQTEGDNLLGARGLAQLVGQSVVLPVLGLPKEPLDEVVKKLAGRFALDPATLRSADRSQLVTSARAALSFVLVRRLGYRVADVADAFGREAATMSSILSRFEGRLESSDRAAADVERLGRKI